MASRKRKRNSHRPSEPTHIDGKMLVMYRTLTTYLFYIRKISIKRRGPPVRDMPRHKQEVIRLLIIATKPVETVI